MMEFSIIRLRITQKFQIHSVVSLFEAANHAFQIVDPVEKAEITKYYSQKWKTREINTVCSSHDLNTILLKEPGRPPSQFAGYNIIPDSHIPEDI
jgi:hypothetical protein